MERGGETKERETAKGMKEDKIVVRYGGGKGEEEGLPQGGGVTMPWSCMATGLEEVWC